MEKQVKIFIKSGTVVAVHTNFDGSYQVIDDDVPDYERIGDILAPDIIDKDRDIFEL